MIEFQDGARGVGVVVCDSCGVLSGAVAMRALGLVSVLATELYTTKTGLSLALDASFDALLLEWDSLQSVNLVNSNDECFVEEGGLMRRFKDSCTRLDTTSGGLTYLSNMQYGGSSAGQV